MNLPGMDIIKDTVITLVLDTRLSALEVLHNICNMGTHDLPDMYARSPRMPAALVCPQPSGFGHTYQTNHLSPCYKYKIYGLSGLFTHMRHSQSGLAIIQAHYLCLSIEKMMKTII